MRNDEKLRIGSVPFANTLPLDFCLREAIPNAEVVRAVPSELGRMLAQGELDVAMLSTIELLRHPDYGMVPGIGVCSDGPVRSVCLYSAVQPERLESVALDGNSLTSVVLLKILLKEYWRSSPRFAYYYPPLSNGLKLAQAALVIGDNTFIVPPEEVRTYDLGEVWKHHTGLPFVFAGWITRPGMDPVTLIEPLSEARRLGLERRKELSERCAKQTNFPVAFFEEYFTFCIQYELTPRHDDGLALYFSKAEAFVLDQIASS